MDITPLSSLRIATRASDLALAQAHWVGAALIERNLILGFQIVTVSTEGDRRKERAIWELGGKGAFTKEVEEALLEGRADIAVHSLKDLPVVIDNRLTLASIPVREDPRDVLISLRPLDWRRPGNRPVIGTSSLRRQAQLLAINPEIQIRPLRGNVATRIERVTQGELDGAVLALAGLRRLGIKAPCMEVLDPGEMLPAPCQGALGVETRLDSAQVVSCLVNIDDISISVPCRAERAFLQALGGSCRTPIAALGRIENSRLILQGLVASPDGKTLLRGSLEADAFDTPPEIHGRELARRLLEQGADKLIK